MQPSTRPAPGRRRALREERDSGQQQRKERSRTARADALGELIDDRRPQLAGTGSPRHAGDLPRRAPRALGSSFRNQPVRQERVIATATVPRVDPVRVEVRGLSKSFGDVRAVSDLAFTVEPGSVTGFLGPNGAGKTTTLRMVLGLVTPDMGSATFDGVPYAALRNPVRTVGAVLETAFHPARSGRDHLRVYCRAAGLPTTRADEVLTQVGLADAGRRRAGSYSLGMRQRLALATALLGDPAVLVLDEPANGLDPEGIQWLRGFLRHMAHEEGRAVLVSSHLLTEVEQTADRVVIVGAGRLVREGSLQDLQAGADGAGTVLVRTPEAGRLAELLREQGSPAEVEDGDLLTVPGLTPAAVGRLAFTAGIELHELRARTSGLEEVYFQLTSGRAQFAARPAATPVPQEALR